MFKVLIVEDERPTARVIAHLVDQHPSFTVVGSEANGERAAQFLQTTPVDLVITDIEMPVMDGLQLLKLIDQKYPQCLSVVLTGFSYFSYARTALQNNALDYILKPIDEQELYRVLEKAKSICKDRHRAQQRKLLEHALAGYPTTDTTPYRILLVSAPAEFWQKKDTELSPCPASHHFNTDPDGERIYLTADSLWKKEQSEQFFHRYRCIPDMIETSVPVLPKDLRQSIRCLRDVLEQQAMLFQGNLLCCDPFHPPMLRREKILRDLHPEQAAEAIRSQNREDLLSCLQKMWDTVIQYGSLRCDAAAWLNAVLSDSRIATQFSPERLNTHRQTLHAILRTSQNRDICTVSLADSLLSILQQTESKRDMAHTVEEIAHFLQTNYHKPITMEALARQYGFVPKYLNKVFRQYTGSRPSEYLLELRIQRAKHILETTPDIMVKDVAASVGYNDHHYFSKVFYRATGFWPTELQQKQ